MAARVHDPQDAGFREEELALLEALPLLRAETAEFALDRLREFFDDRALGQIVHAYGIYRGVHTALAILGAEFVDDEGRPLSERAGFGVVTCDDGSFTPRDRVPFP
jgi:hypothetical protein